MKRLLNVLKNWAIARLVHAIAPDGIKVDGPSLNIYSLRLAVRSIMLALQSVTTIGAQTLTGAQLAQGCINYTGTFVGGAAITLDTVANILSQLGMQTPTDGGFGREICIVNNGTGQTLTLTGNGTASAGVTVSGTATIANNTCRRFMMVITGPTTIVLTNVGTSAL